MSEELTKELEDFVSRAEWRFAKTMPKTPHFYTIREWLPEDDDIFMKLVQAIEEFGYPEKFFRRTFKYLNIGDWKYWHCAHPHEIKETWLINRAERDRVYG